MANKKGYQCSECQQTTIVNNGSVPECCGKTMNEVSLDVCSKPSDAESARMNDADDPCDDSRG